MKIYGILNPFFLYKKVFSFLFFFLVSLHSETLLINNFSDFLAYQENLVISRAKGLVTERKINRLLAPNFKEGFERPNSQGNLSRNPRDTRGDTTRDTRKILWRDGIKGEAAYFAKKDSYIKTPRLKGYFQERNLSSFNLSFYFKAQDAFRDATLLNRKEVTEVGSSFLPNEFHIFLEDGYLKVDLINFFHLRKKFISLQLSSSDLIESEKWNFISLSYDHLTGRLELRINQELVDFTYATANQRPYTSIFNPGFIENENDFFWGNNFLGMIDEIRFYEQNVAVEKIIFDPPTFSSVYASKIFKMGPQTRISRVSFSGEGLDPDEFFLSLCSNLGYFEEKRKFSDCQKVQWDQDLFFADYSTHYQFFLVFKNNQNAQKVVREIRLDYEKLPDLAAPTIINAWVQRDKVVLNWKKDLNPLVNEYRIYVTKNPDDPRNARKITVSGRNLNELLTKSDEYAFSVAGLEEGDKYYFAITAYDEVNDRESKFSDLEEIHFNQRVF